MSSTDCLQVLLLSKTATAPTKGSKYAAGFDLYSSKDVVVPSHGRLVVPTDISIAIPWGTYGRVAPRSGLTVKNSIDIGAGVVDYDYRGAVGVVMINHGAADFKVNVGDRIAQLILEKIHTDVEVSVVDKLVETERGSGGFGSTGK